MVKGWKHLRPAFFYTALAACLIVITSREGFSWRQNFLLIGLGVLSWMLIEYGLHRFVFHFDARSVFGRKLLYAAHLRSTASANCFCTSSACDLARAFRSRSTRPKKLLGEKKMSRAISGRMPEMSPNQLAR